MEPSDIERPVPAVPGGQTGPNEHEVAVDLAAFLPEGTQLGAVERDPESEPVVDPWDTGAPEPEVPAWAIDDDPAAVPAPVADAAPAPEAAPVEVTSPGEPVADPAVAALDRIDEELAAVDDALLALDAGAPERSPLLRDLLG